MNIQNIKKRIIHITSKDIVKVFTLGSFSAIIKILIGIVNAKVVAVLIGPAGIALIGQLKDFKMIFVTFANGGVGQGVTKYIAEYKDSEIRSKLFISSALRITLVLSVLMASSLFLFSGYFSKTILLDSNYQVVFIIFGISIIFFALNRLLLTIVNGYKDFYRFIRINILSSLFSLIFTITLVLIWNVKGALIAQVTFESVVLFITILSVKSEKWWKTSYFFSRIKKVILLKLFRYSLMTVVPIILGPFVMISIRKYLISNISLEAAGYWTGVIRLSGYISGIITQALAIYLLPRFSELKNKYKIKREIINAYKLVFPILLGSFSVLYLLRKQIIILLFSRDFLPMADLFMFQFIGDFFRMTAWIVSVQLISKAMIKVFITSEIIFNLLFLGLSVLSINFFGLIGVVYAYSINYLIYLFFIIFIFRNTLFIRLGYQN